MNEKEVESLIARYKERLKDELEGKAPKLEVVDSREYNQFKEELLPAHFSTYEALCNFSERLVKVEPDKTKVEEIKRCISTCHLNMTPYGVASFAILFPIFWMIAGAGLSFLLFSQSDYLFFVVFFLISGVIMIPILGRMPSYFANNWRLEASNQMVMSIFYVVTYMRHTSNLESAMDFASEHLTGPLALDFKKILWDTETEKFSSVKEALDSYLETWRDWNPEYIESFHLVMSSLYEGSESRRLDLLDKALDVILEETYERMLHYAQNLKNPITMLHMLGIILPILGLVILPLVVAFMPNVKWFYLFMIYNIILPIGVYFLGKNILSKRPTGYGDTDISQENPELRKYRNVVIRVGKGELIIPPAAIALAVFLFLFLVGISPILMHALNPDFDFYLGEDKKSAWFVLLDYQSGDTGEMGPYGLGASVLSLGITLAFGISLGLYFKMRSHNIIKLREEAKKLESEFSSALFQLGNRLGDGLPAEIAFARVADSMRTTTAGRFFQVVSDNVSKLGVSVEQAIFNPHFGALVSFPSKIIQSSMKVMNEASKKGTKIAANAVINISRYIKEMHRVDERLKDILEEIISSMKQQISFLTPVIAGIVIGITSMITTIILRLNEQMQTMQTDSGIGGLSVISSLFGKGIPTFYFQLIVGLYVVQIIYIMTLLQNGIENGNDNLNEKFLLGENLLKSTMLYVFISLVIMLLFNMIASSITSIQV
ncbi:MAG: hypothetical protein V1735_01840 [Nanoarchaeota archaeon]